MIRPNSIGVARGRRILPTICLISAAIIAMVAALSASADTGKTAYSPLTAAATGPTAPGRVNYLPPVNLVDQNGKAVSLSSFKGKPVLIAFIHTSCKGVCEMLTAKTKQVAQSLGTQFNSSVAIVSVTTDPDEDNPAQLLKYAKAQGVDSQGYTFLTGKTPQIDQLLTLYDVPEEGPDETMTHVLDLFLISPDGAGMRKYNGLSVSSQALASDIRSSNSRH
jgi:protein SCO1